VRFRIPRALPYPHALPYFLSRREIPKVAWTDAGSNALVFLQRD
jgi:hypothetical protein